MAKPWTVPKFPKGRVDWAGDVLIDNAATSQANEQALLIINNWRSAHSYPLQALKMTLKKRARVIDRGSVTVQRLKRLPSIAAKLERNKYKHARLSQMQDIGGCRAVVRSIAKVNNLVKAYVDSYAKNPNVRAQFVKAYDYISNPKVDGYRSVHLIYKYRSKSKRHRVWNGLRIEIQIRSKLQHAWATAVETVDAFTGQGLKVRGGTGTEKKDWGRFFALMASAIARREKCNPVPATPQVEDQLLVEIKTLCDRLKVESTLAGWSYAMKRLGVKAAPDAGLFLLTLSTEEYTYSWTAYRKSQAKQAQRDYLEAEKGIRPGQQVVLVSADSMDAVRVAYPNFYVDTRAFLYAVQDALRGLRRGKTDEASHDSASEGQVPENSVNTPKEPAGGEFTNDRAEK